MNLNQVTIYTNKPLETVEFYRKLGLQIIVDSLSRYAQMLRPDGDSTLFVHISDYFTQKKIAKIRRGV